MPDVTTAPTIDLGSLPGDQGDGLPATPTSPTTDQETATNNTTEQTSTTHANDNSNDNTTNQTVEAAASQNQPSSPRLSSPKSYEHPVHSAYNRRLSSKPSQYFENWQQRTTMSSTAIPPAPAPASPASPSKRSSVAHPSPRKLPSIEKKERIACLTEQNESLAKEVKVLCKDKTTLAGRVSKLEDDLHAILARTRELMTENSELSEQMQGTKIQISAKDSMMTSLAKAKSILESEKQYLMDDKSFLENQLLEMNKKLRETAKRADEAESTVAGVVQQIDCLNRNLAKMSKGDATSEVQEIVKQMELQSLQCCKEILKKELKKLTATVVRAREDAAEAKMIIDNCHADDNRYKQEVSRLEKALKSANDYGARLEKQDKMLKSNIELFEARAKSLENELSFVRAERDAAVKEKLHKEASAGGIDAIRASIHILHENAKKGHEQVVALTGMLPQLSEDKERSSEASKQLEKKARELGARSTTISSAAEQHLGKLKQQVDALDSALEEAKDAAEVSESKAWQMIAELSSSPAPQSSSASNKLDLPAATTYALGLGLLAYSVYMSNHA